MFNTSRLLPLHTSKTITSQRLNIQDKTIMPKFHIGAVSTSLLSSHSSGRTVIISFSLSLCFKNCRCLIAIIIRPCPCYALCLSINISLHVCLMWYPLCYFQSYFLIQCCVIRYSTLLYDVNALRWISITKLYGFQ